MHSVGQLLKEARLKKGFTFAQIEKATKIRAKFLTAIEADDYRHMPAAPYIHGFIKNYSDFLGLSTPTMLALFRREFTQKDRLKNVPIEEPLTQSGWRLTPNKVILALVVILIGVLISYFYSQYRELHKPPTMELVAPKDELVTKEVTVAVYGITDADATLTINNEPILIKEKGKFYKDVGLLQGNNTITIISTSRYNQKTTVVRHVTRLADSAP